LTIQPTSAAGVPVLTLGNVTDQIVMRNVVCSRSIIVRHSQSGDGRIPHNAQLTLDGVRCTNRYEYVAADSAVPLDNIRAVGVNPDMVRLGWAGKTITNKAQSGDMVWQLPAATVGLEYNFARQDAHIMDIAPASGESFRGQTADAKLRMNVAGNSAKIYCMEVGVWDMAYSQGAISYV
jgi:hypothetical protein